MPSIPVTAASTSMQRSRRVAEVWNWLPAFRTVAEYESIHKAAAVLRVSASALSRTVRLLEGSLGAPLFVRSNGGLALTAFGAEILEAARDAMRRVDDAVARASSATALRGLLVVGACGASVGSLLARAVGVLSGAPGSPRFRLVTLEPGSVEGQLLRGDADVVLTESARAASPLVAHALGEMAVGLFAPPGSRGEGGVVVPDGIALDGAESAEATAPSADAAARLAEASGLGALLPVVLAPAGFRLVHTTGARVAVHAFTRSAAHGGSSCDEGARAVLGAVRALLREADAQRDVVASPTA
jgi:DNA-binding transcriptional LysR family regulator